MTKPLEREQFFRDRHEEVREERKHKAKREEEQR